MERTQAEQVAALALQGDVAGHHIHDVAAGDKLVQKALIEHENVPPLPQIGVHSGVQHITTLKYTAKIGVFLFFCEKNFTLL